MGRFFYQGQGFCSGTLVARGVVLTAAHCLFDDGVALDAGSITFRPGNTWIDGFDLPTTQYGEWAAASVHAHPLYQQNFDGLDWAIVVLHPNAQAQFPGDVTGAFRFMPNIDYRAGARIVPVGYPSLGAFATFHAGNAQYQCDNSWDGWWDPEGGAGTNHRGNWFIAIQCPMTGGASGGGVFVQLSDGNWYLGGVVNQGYPHKAAVEWMHYAYFDDRIRQFYCETVGC